MDVFCFHLVWSVVTVMWLGLLNLFPAPSLKITPCVLVGCTYLYAAYLLVCWKWVHITCVFPDYKLISGKAKCFYSVVWQMNALFLISFLTFRRFFDRDVNCICDFFKRRFGYESSLHPAFSDVMYVTLQPNSHLHCIALCLNFYWCLHVLMRNLFSASLSVHWISVHKSVGIQFGI